MVSAFDSPQAGQVIVDSRITAAIRHHGTTGKRNEKYPATLNGAGWLFLSSLGGPCGKYAGTSAQVPISTKNNWSRSLMRCQRYVCISTGNSGEWSSCRLSSFCFLPLSFLALNKSASSDSTKSRLV